MVPTKPESVPPLRIRRVNRAPLRSGGSFVLYWMIGTRRASWNFALDRALELARELECPLLVLEPLCADYPWASDRFHRFVLDGMADNAAAFERSDVAYYPYVEPTPGAGRGLVEALAQHASAIVTDDVPGFFQPRLVAAAARAVNVRMEAVDSNGLLPLRATELVFARAYDFRRYLQRELEPYLSQAPRSTPLRAAVRRLPSLPRELTTRWPRADAQLLAGADARLAALPIDHAVAPVWYDGGSVAGRKALARFLEQRLPHYADDRNRPEHDAASGLSPFLHFGHVGTHEVFHAVTAREDWSPDALSNSKAGRRAGWWGLGEPTEAFLDQLVTWREVGFNFCSHRNDYDRFESLPAWARATLDEHASDRRPHLYTPEQFEAAATHDELWNAAQNQLRAEGRIHNYLRMLWGKKILHWSKSPRAALATLIHLNNKYAVDGRDPNSYSGIFWVLGRYDRAWGPEREVFGKIRYMTSESTRRKLRVNDYIRRWNEQPGSFAF